MILPKTEFSIDKNRANNTSQVAVKIKQNKRKPITRTLTLNSS